MMRNLMETKIEEDPKKKTTLKFPPKLNKWSWVSHFSHVCYWCSVNKTYRDGQREWIIATLGPEERLIL